MSKQTFIVEIEDGEDTRWLKTPEEIVLKLEQILEVPIWRMTTGKLPLVKVNLPCGNCGTRICRGGNREGSALCEGCFKNTDW